MEKVRGREIGWEGRREGRWDRKEQRKGGEKGSGEVWRDDREGEWERGKEGQRERIIKRGRAGGREGGGEGRVEGGREGGRIEGTDLGLRGQ